MGIDRLIKTKYFTLFQCQALSNFPGILQIWVNCKCVDYELWLKGQVLRNTRKMNGEVKIVLMDHCTATTNKSTTDMHTVAKQKLNLPSIHAQYTQSITGRQKV